MTYKNDTTQDQHAADRSIKRIRELIPQNMSQQEMADQLNSEGYRTIRLREWTANNIRQVLFKIRHEWASWYGLSARRAGVDASTV